MKSVLLTCLLCKLKVKICVSCRRLESVNYDLMENFAELFNLDKFDSSLECSCVARRSKLRRQPPLFLTTPLLEGYSKMFLKLLCKLCSNKERLFG